MRVSGRMTDETVADMSYFRTSQSISGNILIIKPMVKVSSRGRMVKSMMVNGNKALSKALAYGKAIRVTLILESGATVKSMAMAFTSGKMATDTRVSGRTVSRVVKAQISMRTEILTPEITKWVNHMGLAIINGRMELHMWAILPMASKMVQANGRKIQGRIVTSTMESFSMT